MKDLRTATILDSQHGPFQLFSNGQALTMILLPIQVGVLASADDSAADPILREACAELEAFLEGRLTKFSVPYEAPEGTQFQRDVWNAVSQIPFGETITYTELAVRAGRPMAARAVGAANGKNPLPIIIPCHRVIGTNGTLTGYAGGLPLKQALLEHEARLIRKTPNST